MDKSTWPDGPWKSEPDKLQWVDQASGLDCMIVRNDMGNLCGYVGVADGHPAFGMDYDAVNVDVHGGLSYSNLCSGHICHVAELGRPDHVWWLGFDCAHSFDYTPGFQQEDDYDDLPSIEQPYRDIEFVRQECTQLAAQLVAMK